MSSHASLSQRLPYWAVIDAEKIQLSMSGATPASFLILKDGTIVVGIGLGGKDVYAADNAELNMSAKSIEDIYLSLKPSMFLQHIFETGLSFEHFLDDFAKQGGQGTKGASGLILETGRSERHQMLQQLSRSTGVRSRLWLGQRKIIKPADLVRFRDGEGLMKVCADLTTCYQEVIASLERVGLRPFALSGQDVEAGCFDAVNPREHHVAQGASPLTFREGLDAARCVAPPHASLASRIAQSYIRVADDLLVIGDPPMAARVLHVTRLGTTTTPASLYDTMYAHAPSTPFKICITHEATDCALSRDQISRRMRFISSFVGRHFINHEAQSALEQNDAVLNALEVQGGKLFDSSISLVLFGEQTIELDAATRKVLDGLRRNKMLASVVIGHQVNSWLATLPGYGFHAHAKHAILSANCAHLTPYWIPQLGDRIRDLVFSNRQRGLEGLSVRLGPVRENAGAIVIGGTGSGKTFLFSHLFKYGCLDQGGHVVLADMKGPQNSSYRPLCELLGGEYICLETDREVSFNPFPPHHEVFDSDGRFSAGVLEPSERILCMMAAPHLITHDDAQYAYAVARKVIRKAYLSGQSGRAQVTLSQVLAAFQDYEDDSIKAREVASDMRDRLEIFLRDEEAIRLFDRPKPLDIENPFTVFDFFKMNERGALAGILISILASRIEAKMTQLPKDAPKLFGFDEAWALFQQSPAACALLDRLYRVARSYGAFCYVMTQSFDDVAESAARGGIMSNTSMIFLLRHLGNHKKTAQQLELKPRQEALFRDLKMVAGEYSEFLLIDRHEEKTHLLQYRPTAYDLWCDTSKPSEVAYRQNFLTTSGLAPSEAIRALSEKFPQGLSTRLKSEEK